MTLMNCAFNGLVLAGGQSTRMGQDKALLTCPDGETLMQRAKGLLTSAGAKQVFISSHNPQVTNALTDIFPNRGPVSGIHAALQMSESTPLMVLPVDMPLMTQPVLGKLIQIGASKHISCCYQNQCLPLFIYNSHIAAKVASKLLSELQNLSVWRFIHALNTLELATSAQEAFKNANDTKQWQECQSLMTSST